MIYQWTTVEKRLPHFRLGGRGKRGAIRIDLADLDAFILAQKVEGPPAASASAPVSSGSTGAPFSVLDPERLAKAWRG